MGCKQQIPFLLAVLAMAIIFQSGHAMAQRELLTETPASASAPANADGVVPDIKEMINSTERAKEKISVLGNNQMLQTCKDAYSSALVSLNKAVDIINNGDNKEVKHCVDDALKSIGQCDNVYAKNQKPSPFIPNNENLHLLGAKILQKLAGKA